MYEHVKKADVLREPHRYAWNILLREHQFTQDELVAHRDYIPLPEMIRFQHAVTLPFLRAFFAVDIDMCLEVDWEDCKKWVEARSSSSSRKTTEGA